jgi:hypothetical protein
MTTSSPMAMARPTPVGSGGNSPLIRVTALLPASGAQLRKSRSLQLLFPWLSQAGEKIRQYFGIGQSHDRRNTNGNPRFYRNLALRPPGVVVVEVKDAATAHIHALFGTTSYDQPTFGRCAE